MEIEIWRAGGVGGEAPAHSGGRERPQGRCHPFKQPSSKERTLPLNANNQGSTSERTSFVKRLNKVSRMAEKAKLSRAAVERRAIRKDAILRSEEHTSELKSLMRNSY